MAAKRAVSHHACTSQNKDCSKDRIRRHATRCIFVEACNSIRPTCLRWAFPRGRCANGRRRRSWRVARRAARDSKRRPLFRAQHPAGIRCHEFPAPHAHAPARGDSSERLQRKVGRSRAHCSAQGLIAINALDLRAVLDAEAAGFEGFAALAFVNPDESSNGAPGGDLQTIDHGPTAVAAMVIDLHALGGGPSAWSLASA
eukprot:6193120-Pleurochrysis_carterae.AAC.3